MKPGRTYHVVPHPKGGWAAIRPDGKRASRRGFTVRVDAASWCWRRRRTASVIVHERTGAIAWIEDLPGGGPE